MKIFKKTDKYVLHLTKEQANFLAGELREAAKRFDEEDEWTEKQPEHTKYIWKMHSDFLKELAYIFSNEISDRR